MHKIEDIAKFCHQTNKAYCELLGDNSHKDWENSPEWQKESAIEGVKCRVDTSANLTPLGMHGNWMDKKLKDGWIYGEFKDEKKKTHPCILPYFKLPKEQKIKDEIFIFIVDKVR